MRHGPIRMTRCYSPAKICHINAQLLVLTLNVNNSPSLSPIITCILVKVRKDIFSRST
jgi:hypothetical protein